MRQNGTAKRLTVVLKTPLLDESVSAELPSSMTVSEAIRTIRATPAKTDRARVALQQVAREMSSPVYDTFAADCEARLKRVTADTRLEDLAVVRPVRKPGELITIPIVSLSIQAYLPVG